MRRLLVIDDHVDIRENIAEILSLAGYEVFTAENGKTGVATALKEKPELVICDIMMPELDGFEICRRIRNQPAWRAAKIVMLTAKGRAVERDKGLALGADAYVTKPFSTRDLVAKVKQMLRAR